MFLELADELEHLQRVEPEVREQFTVERGLYRTPADALEDLDSVLFEPIGRMRSAGCVDQGSKCSMIVAECATSSR
jgi:hypothetical protein